MSAALGIAARSAQPALGGPPDGELVVKAAGKILRGWTAVSLTRSVESIPSHFQISATAKYPGQIADIVAVNSPLTIEIGGKTVLTGYLDANAAVVGPEEHELRYQGRGRLRDVVDCSVFKPNNTLINTTVTKLAAWLVDGFAGPIQVVAPDGDGNSRPFDFSANLGETVYEAIERVARYEGLLVYEDANGNLVLSRVGDVKHASGFAEGKNVQAAEFVTDMSQRFSLYYAAIMSVDTLSRNNDSLLGQSATDPGVTTFRPRVIISEQSGSNANLALQRAQWEAQRRKGRGFRVELVADSWLDSAGTPWTPNQMAPVSIPSLGLNVSGWVITDVTYRRDGQSGTTAQVTLMPPEALTVEPVVLNPLEARALANDGPYTPTGQTGSPPSSNVSAPNAGSDARRDRDSYGPPARDGRRDQG